MSIALDVALYLRDHGRLLKGFSLGDRAVLFTLAFRVGSNALTWISQKTLAHELCIDERNLRNHLSNLIKFNLIRVKRNKKDKRKSEYSPSELLINYHQNPKICSTNYRMKSSAILEDTGRNHPVFLPDTGRNHPVISCTNVSQVNESTNENHDEKTPKVTYINKVTLKDKEKDKNAHKKHSLYDPIETPDFLPKELWSEFVQYRKSVKAPMSEIAQRKAFNVLKKLKEEGQDVEAVINNSIVNGWKGLFPIKEKAYGNASGNQSNGNGGKEEFDVFGYLVERSGYKSISGFKIPVPE